MTMDAPNPLERLVEQFIDDIVGSLPGAVRPHQLKAEILISRLRADKFAVGFIGDPNAWDPDHPDTDCECGHVYSRHYDWMTFDDEPPWHVGCKYCSCHDWKEPASE